jgi:ADP-heptose:LPS heptosyltransferase
LESISAEQAASELLACCLNGTPWSGELIERATPALFRVVVERLADLFEPSLCDVYAELFSEIIARSIPSLNQRDLLERYQRVRRPRKFAGASPSSVFVLSRVTLGADVAVTSIVLDAVKKRFPEASIYFVGPEKSWELFAADPALEHHPVSYVRTGSLAERLAAWPQLPDGIVIDPDSRLTQLGLLPVCAEENYYFFESRSYGGDSDASLPDLTRRWVSETFGVDDARPFIAPLPAIGNAADVTVSFGVGENPAKRVEDPFESDLLRYLVEHESSILIDRGAGGEEAGRVERAVAQAGGNIRMWDGSFAGFAAQIARSALYVGYDSAGGHVAAACGVPMVSIFGGYVSERMLQRWRPTGPGPIKIVRASDPASTLRETIEHLT